MDNRSCYVTQQVMTNYYQLSEYVSKQNTKIALYYCSRTDSPTEPVQSSTLGTVADTQGGFHQMQPREESILALAHTNRDEIDDLRQTLPPKSDPYVTSRCTRHILPATLQPSRLQQNLLTLDREQSCRQFHEKCE